jgi:hypothetical protein
MIDLVQRHLQAIYDVEAPDVRDYLVDAEQVREVCGEMRPAREWVLVRQDGEDVGLAVYIHAEDLEAVANRTPVEAVCDALPAWSAVTEGVSHFLLLIRRVCRAEPVSLLELEAQAEVDKYVTARLHVGAHPELRRRLLREATLAPGLDVDEQGRYTEAGRLADRYCGQLDRLRDTEALLAELRRFYRMSGHARMDRLRHAA